VNIWLLSKIKNQFRRDGYKDKFNYKGRIDGIERFMAQKSFLGNVHNQEIRQYIFLVLS